jgi:hypothetical protein
MNDRLYQVEGVIIDYKEKKIVLSGDKSDGDVSLEKRFHGKR